MCTNQSHCGADEQHAAHAVSYNAVAFVDSVFEHATSTATTAVSVGGTFVTLEQARMDALTVFHNCTWRNGVMGSTSGAIQNPSDFEGGALGIQDPGDALRYALPVGSSFNNGSESSASRQLQLECTSDAACVTFVRRQIRRLALCKSSSACGPTQWYRRDTIATCGGSWQRESTDKDRQQTSTCCPHTGLWIVHSAATQPQATAAPLWLRRVRFVIS